MPTNTENLREKWSNALRWDVILSPTAVIPAAFLALFAALFASLDARYLSLNDSVERTGDRIDRMASRIDSVQTATVNRLDLIIDRLGSIDQRNHDAVFRVSAMSERFTPLTAEVTEASSAAKKMGTLYLAHEESIGKIGRELLELKNQISSIGAPNKAEFEMAVHRAIGGFVSSAAQWDIEGSEARFLTLGAVHNLGQYYYNTNLNNAAGFYIQTSTGGGVISSKNKTFWIGSPHEKQEIVINVNFNSNKGGGSIVNANVQK